MSAAIWATGDFNNDGNLDAVVSSALGLSVYLGDGNGISFTNFPSNGVSGLIIGSGPIADCCFVVADFNQDGNLDLAYITLARAGGSPDTISVFLGKGDGTFQLPKVSQINPGVISGPHRVVASDVDGDSIFDLVVLESFSNDLAIFHGNGDGT